MREHIHRTEIDVSISTDDCQIVAWTNQFEYFANSMWQKIVNKNETVRNGTIIWISMMCFGIVVCISNEYYITWHSINLWGWSAGMCTNSTQMVYFEFYWTHVRKANIWRKAKQWSDPPNVLRANWQQLALLFLDEFNIKLKQSGWKVNPNFINSICNSILLIIITDFHSLNCDKIFRRIYWQYTLKEESFVIICSMASYIYLKNMLWCTHFMVFQ